MSQLSLTLRTILVLALLTAPAAAQNKPNFSGQWKMNAAKSDFGLLPAPASFIRKVTHAEPSISIVEDQDAGAGPQTTTRKYTTDGKDVTFDIGGAQVKGVANWDGTTLVVETKVEVAFLHYVDRMSLSEGGKVLTSEVHVTSPDGAVDLKVVFERQ